MFFLYLSSICNTSGGGDSYSWQRQIMKYFKNDLHSKNMQFDLNETDIAWITVCGQIYRKIFQVLNWRLDTY